MEIHCEESKCPARKCSIVYKASLLKESSPNRNEHPNMLTHALNGVVDSRRRMWIKFSLSMTRFSVLVNGRLLGEKKSCEDLPNIVFVQWFIKFIAYLQNLHYIKNYASARELTKFKKVSFPDFLDGLINFPTTPTFIGLLNDLWDCTAETKNRVEQAPYVTSNFAYLPSFALPHLNLFAACKFNLYPSSLEIPFGKKLQLFTISPELGAGGFRKVETYWLSWFGIFVVVVGSRYSCWWLKLVGGSENEGLLVGEGEED
ncbi:hypothetical protein H5410_055707 [Solanum commersonii]|uniref:Uncharacterized protein n=1 Tax=Solanum commersonii TaxID=4109 RepID=A0A9J5WJH5_SOLCO|nr:hypothetical protein H5410_055707 [Solanum commersonii]